MFRDSVLRRRFGRIFVRGSVNVRVDEFTLGAGAGRVSAAAVCILTLAFGVTHASADTLRGALTEAYQNNPQLNAQRAAVRATDESVPQALSGYRPRISLSASVG